MKFYTINSIESMQQFFTDIIVNYDCSLSPDDSFKNIVDQNTNRVFTDEGAEYLDEVMTQCFDYCEVNGLDLYEFASEIQVMEFKKRELLPC
ncbi:MAG: hypothetical protein J0I41_23485 [Filimonas sp.]|nr:hypothetical protein [Filimonas sp.]